MGRDRYLGTAEGAGIPRSDTGDGGGWRRCCCCVHVVQVRAFLGRTCRLRACTKAPVLIGGEVLAGYSRGLGLPTGER